MAALAVGATALIVPGTGTPSANIVEKYMEHAADRYIAPFTGSACTSTNGCNLDGIDYPASFWPLGFIGNWCPGYQRDRWDVSVGDGVESLDTAPIRNPEPNADDKDADEIKAGDETNADETRSDTGKKGDTGKQPEETKAIPTRSRTPIRRRRPTRTRRPTTRMLIRKRQRPEPIGNSVCSDRRSNRR